MNLTAASVVSAFGAKVTPTGTGATGKVTVGFGSRERKYPASDVVGVLKVKAGGAGGNAITLTLATLAAAQTSGTGAIISDGDGKDIEGITFPTVGKVMAMRLTTAATNTGTVTVAGSSAGLLPAFVAGADTENTHKLPAAGSTHSAATQVYTFSAANDEITIELLGKAS